MRITQEADYALRIIYRLACANKDSSYTAIRESKRVMDSKTIADVTGVPERFTVKILRKLNLSGLVCSYKGSSGGYALAVEPSEISMKRVVEIIDGPLEISRCLDSAYECTHSGEDMDYCIFRMVFDKINSELAQKLDSVNIGELIGETVNASEILKKI